MKPQARLGQDNGGLTLDVRAPEICPPLAFPQGAEFSARQRATRRAGRLAFVAAVAGHGVITACLLVTLHTLPPQAPGQKAVEMVFETPASTPAPAAAQTETAHPPEPMPVPPHSSEEPKPSTPAEHPPALPREAHPMHHPAEQPQHAMAMPEEALAAPLDAAPTPALPPPVPPMTDALPAEGVPAPLALRQPQPVPPHEHQHPPHATHTMPANKVPPSMAGASPPAPAANAAASSIAQPAKVAPTQAQAAPSVAAAQASHGPSAAAASVAHVAKGSGARTLVCTPPQTHYPPMARHLHEEGEAVVEVTLAADGTIAGTRLTQSSGYDDLDAQALTAARGLHCAAPASAPMVGRIPVGFHIR